MHVGIVFHEIRLLSKAKSIAEEGIRCNVRFSDFSSDINKAITFCKLVQSRNQNSIDSKQIQLLIPHGMYLIITVLA